MTVLNIWVRSKSTMLDQELRSQLPTLGESLQKQVPTLVEGVYEACTTSRSWLGRSFTDDRRLVLALTHTVIRAYVDSLLESKEHISIAAKRESIDALLAKLLVGRSREEFIAYLHACTEQFVPVAQKFLSPEQVDVLQRLHPHYTADLAFWAARSASSFQRANHPYAPRSHVVAAQALLAGRLSALDKLQELGWEKARDYTCAYVAKTVEFPVAGQVRALLAESDLQWIFYWGGNEIFIVLAAQLHSQSSPRQLLAEVAQAAQLPLTTAEKTSSLSELFSSVAEVKEASRVRQMLPSIGELMTVEELIPEMLIAGNLPGAPLVERYLRPLQNLDAEVVATLRHYVALGGDLKATAQAAKLHPNTVRYRLRKISALKRWNLSDPRDRYCLQVALSAALMD